MSDALFVLSILPVHSHRLLFQALRPQPATNPVVPWQTTLSTFGSLGALLLAIGVAVVEAWRARTARRERDQLANAQTAADRRRTTSLVSTWVEEGYFPNLDGRTYTRAAVVHIANEGEQPMFDVSVLVGVGHKTRSIGPLTVPGRIPVLPPRREFAWDITLPLLAHHDTDAPCAALIFTDPAGQRWERRFDGSLEEITGMAQLVAADEQDEQQVLDQLGDLHEIYNPMGITFDFLSTLRQPPDQFDLQAFQATLAPEAPGWQQVTAEGLDDLRSDLAEYSVGALPYYPVPHVAYVKIIQVRMETTMVVSGEDTLELPSKFLTLTFAQERGWRVFGYGPRVPVERIQFPPGTLSAPRDPQSEPSAAQADPTASSRRRRRYRSGQ